jgi:GNAT superfamily N-acetyltransferase
MDDPAHCSDAPIGRVSRVGPESAAQALVLREFAGRGWLTRLIDFAANEALDRGIPRLRLDTLCKSPLQDLYARHGFAAIDESPLVVHGRLMIRMERVLV